VPGDSDQVLKASGDRALPFLIAVHDRVPERNALQQEASVHQVRKIIWALFGNAKEVVIVRHQSAGQKSWDTFQHLPNGKQTRCR